MSEGLPKGWGEHRLGQCVTVLDSLRVPVNSDERAKRIGDIPYYGATGQVGWINDYLFDEELLLIGEDGAPFFDKSKPISYIIAGKSWVNNHAHVLRARSEITTNKYLKYFLDWFDFNGYVNGTTRLKLTQGSLNQIPTYIAPLNEQRRIVAKLEKLLGRVDSCQKRLAKVPILLKRFRQAVLSAACSGQLTEDWRDGKGSGLGDWQRLELHDLLAEPLTNGRSVVDATSGFPVLRLTCLKNGRVDLSERKIGAWTAEQARKFVVSHDDFFVARGNGSLSLVGRGGLVEDQPDPVAYPDTLIRIRLDQRLIAARFLKQVWNCRFVRDQIERVARTTAGIWKISQRDIEGFTIPVPPYSEQEEIVRRIDELFSLADQIGSRYGKGKTYVDSLKQSILAKAFRGELVPQDPNDERATVLLERIRQARAGHQPGSSVKRAQKSRPPRKRQAHPKLI